MTDLNLSPGAERRHHLRAVANNAILHIHPTRVAKSALRWSYTWGLGGISALLFTMLVLTGILLMFRYEPTVSRAYASVQALESQVMFGSLFRAIHHWSANLLIVTTFLHLLRVFLTGGYKQGRGLNWLIGLLMLLLVVAFNFTGYLLPWDQLAYWAITVGTSLLSYIPLIGEPLSHFLLAGHEVGQAALSNFYAFHVAVLPVLMAGVMGYHFWRIRKDGGISQPDQPDDHVERVTTIPNLVQREMMAAAIVFTGVVIWSMVQAAPLTAVANPALSPNPAKAAWYFLGFQELLLHMHPLAAMTLVGLVLLGLIFLPRWDKNPETIGVYFRSRNGRRAALFGLLAAIDLVPLLVIADEFWLDLPAWQPAWPVIATTGLLPLAATLLGLLLLYGLQRLLFKTTRGEAIVGMYTFIFAALIVLTIIGVYFRGPNMALVMPG